MQDNLKEYDNFTLINEDFLKLDIHKLIEEHNCKNIKVVANLPYYITTPILSKFLQAEEKEVTENEIAEIIASWTGIPVKRMLES